MLYQPSLTKDQSKNILVLSDVHIGRKWSYWRNAITLMSSYNWKKIIVCGDFFDLWYSPTAIFALLTSTIFQKIGNKIVYVLGNHDDEILDNLFCDEPFLLVTKQYIETIGDKRFLFIHGHQVDKFNSQVSWVGKLLTKLQALLHRMFKADTHRFTSGLLFRIREREQRRLLIKKYAPDNNVLVFGHTHKPLEQKYEDKFGTLDIYNTGDWVRNKTFLVIDENGNVTSYKDINKEHDRT